jgi:hypothetical protein
VRTEGPKGNGKWKPVNIGEIMDATALKKKYQRACIVVHPDRTGQEEYADLAREIFIKLNEAGPPRSSTILHDRLFLPGCIFCERGSTCLVASAW